MLESMKDEGGEPGELVKMKRSLKILEIRLTRRRGERGGSFLLFTPSRLRVSA
jgi:hypothetical protein